MKNKIVSLLRCGSGILGCLAFSSSAHAVTVFIEIAERGAVPSPPLVVTTGSVRQSVPSPPINRSVPGTISAPEASGPARRDNAAPEDSGNTRSAPKRNRARVTPSPSYYDSGSAKEALPPMEVEYTDPGAFTFSAEAGYASKHLWRGIDLVEFTSFNHAAGGALKKADSGVTFFGANATYKGFGFGAKFIESIDDQLNPFFAANINDQDSYQELVLSLNYTRMLVGENILQGTVGFDFYYYPNDEFWGVEHQGMLYARFSSPKYKWAQPFVEVFYNIATDTTGSGLAAGNFRGATGSALVEGGGAEFGVNGGDVVWTNDRIAVGLTYSLSGFYKTGYEFEDDGLSHVSLTVGAPVSFGSNFTITPSVTYVQELSDIAIAPGAGLPGPNLGRDPNPSAYNEPGFVGAIKASWSF